MHTQTHVMQTPLKDNTGHQSNMCAVLLNVNTQHAMFRLTAAATVDNGVGTARQCGCTRIAGRVVGPVGRGKKQ